MPVQRINIVHEQTIEEVDERGMDSPHATPAGLFLQVALATWDRSSKAQGRRSDLLLAHRDDGAAVSLINSNMLSEVLSMSIHWVEADVQGIASNQMCRMIVSFPKAAGTGWVNIYTKLYLCTVIPFALLLGRPLIEDPATKRFGDSAHGVQRFGPGFLCSRFVRPPTAPPVGKSERIPVYELLDTLLPPGVQTIIPKLVQLGPYLAARL
jgi:hypothetical protein